MPVLIRYYLKAIWPPFLVAIGIWLFVLNLLFEIVPILDYVFKYQAGFINSMRLLIYIQPSFLVLVIPIGYLSALLIVYGRLSADRETMAIESSGISQAILIWPLIGISLAMSGFLVLLMDKILPWGNTSYVKLQSKIISERSAIAVRERIFIKDFEGYLLYIKQKDDSKDLLEGVTVWFLDPNYHAYRVINAAKGTLRQDPDNFHELLCLSEGSLQQDQAGSKEPQDEFLVMKFKNCTLDLNAHKLPSGPGDFSDARNISIGQLAQKIEVEKEKKIDTKRDEYEFHKKFSIPFSALAFAFIGIPLGLIFRTSTISGLSWGTAFVIAYDLFLEYGDAAVPRNVISPFLAMWIPNFVLIAAGLVMIYWLNHRLDFWHSLFNWGSGQEGKTGGQDKAGNTTTP